MKVTTTGSGVPEDKERSAEWEASKKLSALPVHTEDQIREKRECIRRAAVQFIADYKSGNLDDDAALQHAIESIYELVRDVRRG